MLYFYIYIFTFGLSGSIIKKVLLEDFYFLE